MTLIVNTFILFTEKYTFFSIFPVMLYLIDIMSIFIIRIYKIYLRRTKVHKIMNTKSADIRIVLIFGQIGQSCEKSRRVFPFPYCVVYAGFPYDTTVLTC